MKTENITTGFICRGVLVGYRKQEETYVEKSTGQVKTVTVHLMGLLRNYTNKYGRPAEMVVDLRIPNKLADDGKFISSIDRYYEMMIEVQLSGLTDYPAKRHFLDVDAQIQPCGVNIQAATAA